MGKPKGGGGGGGKGAAAEKEAAKKARKAEAAAKKAKKGAVKAAKKGGADADELEEDIEVVLAALAAEEAKRTAVTVTPLPDRPPARANFSLTPLPSGELVLFGGEFYDGRTNACYNELFRFAPKPGAPGGGEWKLITSPATPPHRCSHQAVLGTDNKSLFVYGGEFATANQFHHWGDTWRLELDTNRWTRLDSKRAPSQRSGHRMAVWRSYVLLFGGFHQSLTQDKWFADTWVLDTRTGQWTELVWPVTALLPAARSGHALAAVPGKDVLLLYGGYSEVRSGKDADDAAKGGGGKKALAPAAAAAAALLTRKTRSVVHTDLWVLRLAPLVAPGAVLGAPANLPVWERVRYVGVPPSPRLGCSLAMYRDRAIVFGGVADSDGDERGETLVSSFYNDLHSYDADRRRWYALDLKRKAAAGGSRRAKGGSGGKKGGGAAAAAAAAGDDDDAVSLGSGDEDEDDEDEAAALRGGGGSGGGGGGHDALDDDAYYMYVDGKLVKMEVEDDDEDAAEGEGEAAGEKAADKPAVAGKQKKTAATAAAPLPTAAPAPEVASQAPPAASAPATAAASTAATPALPPLPAPPGRMKSAMWVDGHWLFVYGGVSEGRQRETTWDDLWRIDLRERAGWECVLPARPHEWKGDDSDDDEDEDDDSDEDGSGSDDDEEDDDDGSGSGSDSGDGSDDGVSSALRKGASLGADGTDSPNAGRHARGYGRGGKELARIRALRERLGVEDAHITPQPGEELRAFFARTVGTWVSHYCAHVMKPDEMIVGKDLRRKAFALARERYDAVWPQLQELFELEEEQKRIEADRAKRHHGHRHGGGGGGGGGGGRAKGR
jgi:uncharacterized membrane protein YgcG